MTLLPPGTFNFRYLSEKGGRFGKVTSVWSGERGSKRIADLSFTNLSLTSRRAHRDRNWVSFGDTEKLSAAGCELSLAPAIDRRPTDLGQSVAVWTASVQAGLRVQRASVSTCTLADALHTPAWSRAAAHTDDARVVTRNFTSSGEMLKQHSPSLPSRYFRQIKFLGINATDTYFVESRRK